MRDRLATFVATGFGIGWIPFAPGTAGSLLGIVYWWGLTHLGSWWAYGLGMSAGWIVAVLCSGRAAKLLQKRDPACVVIDEITAVPLALAGVAQEWWQVGLGFALFRLFDIWKPFPVRQSQSLPGGWGIVVDDILAAIYACAGIHATLWVTVWIQS